jgi:hypothetical protein
VTMTMTPQIMIVTEVNLASGSRCWQKTMGYWPTRKPSARSVSRVPLEVPCSRACRRATYKRYCPARRTGYPSTWCHSVDPFQVSDLPPATRDVVTMRYSHYRGVSQSGLVELKSVSDWLVLMACQGDSRTGWQ